MSETTTVDRETVVERVRERYGAIAEGSSCGCGCSPAGGLGEVARGIGYRDGDLAAIPEEANLGLGCGAPVDHLALQAGETVLDLGSGAGIDAFLAARQVGPEGRVIGVDMTPEMIERATASAVRHGLEQVHFRLGRLEAMPVDDSSVDAVTSNCVINLVPDKGAVFREVARVLRPGGRMVISDILLDGELPEALSSDLLAWVGCVAGAERREVYFGRLTEAGLGEVEVLRDVDYAAMLWEVAPGEAEELLGRLGLSFEDVRGVVRSVTYRARKPEAERDCCGPSCCGG